MTTETTDPRPADSGDADFRALGAQVTAAMAKYRVPGVAVGLVHAGAERLAGWGVTNVEQPLPVDGDTLFQIGSTTKTVTGTLAMRLVEAGTLDLDAPVQTYLPGLRLADAGVAARVTMRHLLTHSGGWAGDYFDDTGRGADALAAIVARLVDLPQLTPLGEIWSYNNAGFYLAGRVIEVLTGQPYETAVKQGVLDPLGMDRSFYFAEDVLTYRFAVGHQVPYEPDQPVTVERDWAMARAAHPVGGIISTARDQMRYARFHLGDGTAPDGTRVLAPASLAQMQTPAVPAANGEFVGLTWFMREVGGTRILRHGGATKGQLSAFLMVPARRFALTVLTNADRGDELHRAVTKWALAHYLGVVDPEPAPQTAGSADLAPYAGHYTGLAGDLDLAVGEVGLVMQITPKGGFPRADSPPGPTPPPARLALCGPDQIIALNEPFTGTRGEFLRDAQGRIAWLRIGGRVHKRD